MIDIMKGKIMSERTINIWKDPYGEGFDTCKSEQVTLHSGLTVLVGCNGAGKSTLLKNIKSELDKYKIPYHSFDNLNDGGSRARENAAFEEDFAFLATSASSSEGENITMNIGTLLSKLKKFMRTGRVESRTTKLIDALSGEEYKVPETKERWLLLDAIDSGYSIDNVVAVKRVLKLVINDFKLNGYDLFIVASANEYELANGEDCFDVNAGEYVKFKDYKDFKKFILKSREIKDTRYKSKIMER